MVPNLWLKLLIILFAIYWGGWLAQLANHSRRRLLQELHFWEGLSCFAFVALVTGPFLAVGCLLGGLVGWRADALLHDWLGDEGQTDRLG